MTASKQALHAKHAAAGAARIADKNSTEGHPWSLANVRVWQNVMCRALDERSAIIRAYLDRRSARRS